MADFCPMCHDVRPFRLWTVRPVLMLWGFPLWFFRTSDSLIRCTGCGTLFTEAYNGKTTPVKRMLDDVVEMVERTRPHSLERINARMALESSVRSGEADEEDQIEIFAEPFVIAGHVAKAAADRTDLLLATPLILVIPLAAAAYLLPSVALGVATLIFFLANIGVLVYRMRTGPRQAARGVGLDMIARALRPFDPTVDQLQRAMDLAKSRDVELARLLSPEQVLDRLHAKHRSAA